jgi:hypothetical protein
MCRDKLSIPSSRGKILAATRCVIAQKSAVFNKLTVSGRPINAWLLIYFMFLYRALWYNYVKLTNKMHLCLNNQPDALIIPILFCYKILHVSGIFSAHHQEFYTVQSSSVISKILLKVNLHFVSTSFPNVQTFTYHSKTHYDMKLVTIAPHKFLYLLYCSYRWWAISNIRKFIPNFSKMMQFYQKWKWRHTQTDNADFVTLLFPL